MKKFGLSMMAVAAMFFSTAGLQAQETEAEMEVETEVEAQEEVVEQEMEMKQEAKAEFQRIEVVALPQAVKEAIINDFDGSMAEEAWVKEEDGKTTYKLALNVEGEMKKVYADQDGNWVEEDGEEDDK
ncbi:hypothetical protein [Salegentibacter chungangensis]|uniref:PepSY domain-containing protein n=1 Tax=Salegentibacter chungangensis TaxID=1335724 RepID=A0ABW3NMK0_9FLAO